MQNSNIIQSPIIYNLDQDYSVPKIDASAWPSSYYGKTRRIDLAKFYQDIVKESNVKQSKPIKRVTFSSDPPTVHEYEPEYDNIEYISYKDNKLFDDGWPGRTKQAMATTEFMDFRSKIEAKLGAINDPSLLAEIDQNQQLISEPSLLEKSGYYRHRKSPFVQKLNLSPVPSIEPLELVTDTPSPSNSYTESPLTPRDNYSIPTLPVDMNQSLSSTSSNSSSSSSSNNRWFKSLTKLKRQTSLKLK